MSVTSSTSIQNAIIEVVEGRLRVVGVFRRWGDVERFVILAVTAMVQLTKNSALFNNNALCPVLDCAYLCELGTLSLGTPAA